MKTLTPLQIEVLLIIANNEHHDGLNPVGNPLFSWGMFNNKREAAAVASCVKAGYLVSFEDKTESTLSLTEKGSEALEQSGYFLREENMCFLTNEEYKSTLNPNPMNISTDGVREMKVELKNLKIAHHLSEETLAFTADVFVDGVKAGTVKNDGQGGSDICNLGSYKVKLEAWAKTQERDPLFPDDEMNLELMFSRLIDEAESRAKLRKLRSRSLLFQLKGDPDDQWRTIALKGVGVTKARSFINSKYGNLVDRIANDEF